VGFKKPGVAKPGNSIAYAQKPGEDRAISEVELQLPRDSTEHTTEDGTFKYLSNFPSLLAQKITDNVNTG
jgi:hypothetical protein